MHEEERVVQYRSAVTDALGRVIPDEGDLRVWLDDDIVDRRAPEGWIHLVTAREVCFLLSSGRVVELSLDHDLSDDTRFGKGHQVIDFLDEQQALANRVLWPRQGITLHTANAAGRDAMARALRTQAARHVEVIESRTRVGSRASSFRASVSPRIQRDPHGNPRPGVPLDRSIFPTPPPESPLRPARV